MTLCFAMGGAAQIAGEEALVNLSVAGEAVQNVAAQIFEQTGVQVAITEDTDRTLTGQLEDRTVEESVELLATGAQASWMRAYILESSHPEEPCSAEELLGKLRGARNQWLEGLTNRERQRLFGRIITSIDFGDAAAAADRADEEASGAVGRMLAGPGGGVAIVRTAAGTPESDMNVMRRYEDPIRMLLLPERSETVSLDFTDEPLHEALSAFTMDARFLVIADEELDGRLTLRLDDAPLSEALDAFAETTDAQWRPVYVIGQPTRLSDREVASREDQFEEQAVQLWGEFWRRDPQERESWVQLGVLGIEQVSARMRNAPAEDRAALEEVMNRVFDFMVGYSTRLTPEQRLELRPIMQALARTRAN